VKVIDLPIAGLKLIEPRVFSDERGAFMETFNESAMAAMGLPTIWVQDNCSISKRNVLRGIHYQVTHPQGKLVRVASGRVLDIAVDLRRSSLNFGKYAAVELSEANQLIFWIPQGFGHAFLALSECVSFAYKTTDYYDSTGERTIRFDDPDIAIKWPISATEVIVSAKDRLGVPLRVAETFD
jgi:dTDP-4-dehydrorhamnose 3,5-epimerase